MRKKKRKRGRRNLLIILCFAGLCIAGMIWIANDEIEPIVPPDPGESEQALKIPEPELLSTNELVTLSTESGNTEQDLQISEPDLLSTNVLLPSSPGMVVEILYEPPYPAMPSEYVSRPKLLVPIEDTLLNSFNAYTLSQFLDISDFKTNFGFMNFYHPDLLADGTALFTEELLYDGSISFNRGNSLALNGKIYLGRFDFYLFASRYQGDDRLAMQYFLDEVEKDVQMLFGAKGIKNWQFPNQYWEHAYELINVSSEETLKAGLARLQRIRKNLPSPAVHLRAIFKAFDERQGREELVYPEFSVVDQTIGDRIFGVYIKAKRAREWRQYHDYVRENFDDYLHLVEKPWLEYNNNRQEIDEFTNKALRIGVSPTFIEVKSDYTQAERLLAGLETMFGLGLYRLDHGEYPLDLNVLVPDYLKVLPLDPLLIPPVEDFENERFYLGWQFSYRREADGYVFGNSTSSRLGTAPGDPCNNPLFHHSPQIHPQPDDSTAILSEWKRIGPFSRREEEPSPHTLLHLNAEGRTLEQYAEELGTQVAQVVADEKTGAIHTGDYTDMPREQVYYFLTYVDNKKGTGGKLYFNADTTAYLWFGEDATTSYTKDIIKGDDYYTRAFPWQNLNGLESRIEEVQAAESKVPVLVRLNCLNGRNAFSVAFEPN